MSGIQTCSWFGVGHYSCDRGRRIVLSSGGEEPWQEVRDGSLAQGTPAEKLADEVLPVIPIWKEPAVEDHDLHW